MRHDWKIGTAIFLALSACGERTVDTDKATPIVQPSQIELTQKTTGYNPSKNVYFGDLHIHTKNSFDAYIFNVRTTPADVYRFALGEPLTHPGGFEMALSGPPLDFVAATDHGAYMGILPAMNDPDSPLSELEISKKIFDGNNIATILFNFQTIGSSVRTGKPIQGARKAHHICSL